MNKFEVGQVVITVSSPYSNRPGTVEEAKITKVGRKWVELDHYHGRFDKETMLLDGGCYSSPGKVYFSQLHYDLTQQHLQLWRDMRKLTDNPWYAPIDMNKVHQLQEIINKFKELTLLLEEYQK